MRYKMKITKNAIEALATDKVANQYDLEKDKDLYLEHVIVAAGFDISLTDRPKQWDRCIEWLENALDSGPNDREEECLYFDPLEEDPNDAYQPPDIDQWERDRFK